MMSTSKLILVTGATGNQGGAVMQSLLKRGHRVRALTRNGSSASAEQLRQRGVEIAVGDFTDHDSLARAVRGVDAVYTMTTPFEGGVAAETAQGIAITDAAKEAGAGHLVYSSVASADKATGIPHFDSKYEVEKYIAASGVPYTIIAPVFFMDNYLSPWTLPGLREGKLAQAMPGERPLQQIAVSDIGDFAAAVIERGTAVHGKRFDIAGDELTGEEAVAIMAQAAGRDIGYEGFSPDFLRSQSEDMALMYEWFDTTGYVADIVRLRRDFPEVNWHSFSKWAQNQDWSVLQNPN